MRFGYRSRILFLKYVIRLNTGGYVDNLRCGLIAGGTTTLKVVNKLLASWNQKCHPLFAEIVIPRFVRVAVE
jgi:hypothetical protein